MERLLCGDTRVHHLAGKTRGARAGRQWNLALARASSSRLDASRERVLVY